MSAEIAMPRSAIVLAAGLGKRMRPLTETVPKPLVRVAGAPLIDHGLDALARAGIGHAVVNVHYLPEPLVAHVSERGEPSVAISDETDRLLDSGGGVARALAQARPGPVALLNADTFWIDAPGADNLRALAAAWDPGRMDMLLMLAPVASAVGHTGTGDFAFTDGTAITRSRTGHVYAGAAILDPAIFEGDEPEVHSLNMHFDRLIARGRLHGHVMDGLWLTVGTPDAIGAAEEAIVAYRHGAA